MDNERDKTAFQDAIDSDPTNHALRMVFADFLDENGEHDLAKDHRYIGSKLKEYHDANDWYRENGLRSREDLSNFLPHPQGDLHDKHWINLSSENPFVNQANRYFVLRRDRKSSEEYRPESEHPEHVFGDPETKVFSDGSVLQEEESGPGYLMHDMFHPNSGRRHMVNLADHERNYHEDHGYFDDDERARFLIDNGFLEEPE